MAEAQERHLRLSYEPMSRSVSNPALPEAWALVRTLDLDVIGLVVDSYYVFSRGRSANYLNRMPARSIFAVQ